MKFILLSLESYQQRSNLFDQILILLNKQREKMKKKIENRKVEEEIC